MSMIFECPSCGKKLKAQETSIGKKTKCPHCDTVFTVPEPVYEAEERPAPDEAEEDSSPRLRAEPPDDEERRRPCPMCGEMILASAVKCRYCGEIFDETLKRKEKKKKAADDTDATLSGGEIALAVLCSGIGCIMGIVWMIQGKPKGIKMVGLSFLMSAFWGVVRVIVEQAMKNN